MRHIWSVLCESVSVDRDTNDFSIIDVREAVTITTGIVPDGGQFSVPLETLHLATLWARSEPESPETGRFRVALESRGRRQIASEENVDLTMSRRVRVVVAAQGIRVNISDETRREIDFVTELPDEAGGWVEVSRVPFEIAVERDPDLPPFQEVEDLV